MDFDEYSELEEQEAFEEAYNEESYEEDYNEEVVENEFSHFKGYSEREAVIEDVDSTVESLAYVDMYYPSLIIKDTEGLTKIEGTVIGNLVNSTQNLGSDKIALYIKNEEDLLQVGFLGKQQASTLINMLGVDRLEGFDMNKKELKGYLLYIFS